MMLLKKYRRMAALFMRTEKFGQLARRTKTLAPEDIEWYSQDWGRIVWPPGGRGMKEFYPEEPMAKTGKE
ncbi:MAG: hypothetical protein J5I94_08525 [Phaeodactylibacter sp.]|nr:hypothetical protein [Phaeodactylibacter sp.]